MFSIIASTFLLLTFSFTSNSAVSFAATQGAIGPIPEAQSSESVKQNEPQETCKDEHGDIVCP